MPRTPRPVVLGALGMGVLAALSSCASGAASTTNTTALAPLATAFATMPPVTSPPTTAVGETTTLAPGQPTSYTVQSNDYLYGIAKQHGVAPQDIVTLNGWESVNHELVPGQEILIPAPTASVATTPATAPPPNGPPIGSTSPPTPLVDGSAADGSGDASDTSDGSSDATAAGTAADGSTAGTAAGGQSYTVKNNDTVYGLAKKFGCTPQALVAANGWSDVGHPLYPGDVITIPAAG